MVDITWVIIFSILGFLVIVSVIGVFAETGELMGEPNTITLYCEWTIGDKWADCFEHRYWHDDDYNVIHDLHIRNQRLVSSLT